MIKRIVLLLIFILTLSTPALAAEPGSGVIEGRIVNGTADGSSVADQNITLKTNLNDAEVGSATTKTDAEGRFVFDSLSTEPSYSYQVIPSFQEAEYYSEWLTFDEGGTSNFTEIVVYDSTMSDEAIKVDTVHTIVYVGQGSLEVVEFFLFVNESDRTYIGTGEITATGTRRTVILPLPDKMTELQYGGELMECCVLLDEEGFFDTMPIYPGDKEVSYSYKVDYRSGQYVFSQQVNYPILGYNLFVQGEGIEVTSDQLTRGDPLSIEGSVFNYFSGTNLASGENLVVQLSGLPQTIGQGLIWWVILALVLLAGSFGFVYLRRKGRLQPVRVEGNLEQRRQRLLAELAQMDDDFENGKISEEVYHRRRTERKAQLVELMRRSKE